MRAEMLLINADDNSELFTYRWLPDTVENIKGVIQIFHGMAEHSARYERFAEFLTSNGFAVYSTDMRGHGKSAEISGLSGYFADKDGWKKVVRDQKKISEKIEKEFPGKPLFFFAHSMGSLIARDLISTYKTPLKGVILSGTPFNPGVKGALALLISNIETLIRGKKSVSKFMDKITFGSFNSEFKPPRTSFDWISRDEKEVDSYVNDSKCGEIFKAGFFSDLFRGTIRVNSIETIASTPQNLPLLFMSGDNDPVGDRGKGVIKVAEMYKKAGVKNVKIKLYKNGRHEMLNEINRAEVFNDIMNWINGDKNG